MRKQSPYGPQFQELKRLLKRGVRDSENLKYKELRGDAAFVLDAEEPDNPIGTVRLVDGYLFLFTSSVGMQEITPTLKECPAIAETILRDMGARPKPGR